MTNGELQSKNSEALKLFSTSVVIQVLLALYPEADSLSWQSHSWLYIKDKWFSSIWTCTFMLYKIEINYHRPEPWHELFETSTVQKGIFQYPQFTHREDEIEGLKMHWEWKAEYRRMYQVGD